MDARTKLVEGGTHIKTSSYWIYLFMMGSFSTSAQSNTRSPSCRSASIVSRKQQQRGNFRDMLASTHQKIRFPSGPLFGDLPAEILSGNTFSCSTIAGKLSFCHDVSPTTCPTRQKTCETRTPTQTILRQRRTLPPSPP